MSKAVAKVDKSTTVAEYHSFDSLPDYLKDEQAGTGIENLDKSDYRTPRIILLQGLSPQVQSFPETARVGQFWHTGMNVSLGESFNFVPLIARKRVVLFRPRGDQGGGMLAFSSDARKWDSGGNTAHSVKLKGRKDPVIWNTGKDVISSRLTEWGTSNPDEPNSPPAANVTYEYLIYLPERPELSPCVMLVTKTGLTYAKGFNTSLLTFKNAGKPIQSMVVKCFPEAESNEDGEWTVPNYKPVGIVSKETYAITKALAEQYSDYKVEYTQDEVDTTTVKDEIQY